MVVTGAPAGLGRAIARHFGSKGARVGLLARGIQGLEGAKAEIEAAGGKALLLPTDVADADAMEKAAAAVEQAFGPRVKSRLKHKAQPVPPIFQPEVGARAVYWAAHHDRREVYVGMPTVEAIVWK